MENQKIERNIHNYVYRLVPLENSDLLILLEKKILCVKSPDYTLNNCLEIIYQNSKIDAISLWKDNCIIIKVKSKLIVLELFTNNTNYRIISESDLEENIPLIFQRIIPLNNFSILLLNSSGKFITFYQPEPNKFSSQYTFIHKGYFNSFLQIKPDELVCNSADEKKVFFIDFKKGKIIKEINNIQTYLPDTDSFCKINDDVVAMGGDLRDGIYFFDINKRELIYQYKKDYRGYHHLLSLGNNKFLGESYEGRCYGESDDDLEPLYCTKFFIYNTDTGKIKEYKSSDDRVFDLRRSNFVKFKNENKIAYYSDKIVYIEKI